MFKQQVKDTLENVTKALRHNKLLLMKVIELHSTIKQICIKY